MIKISSFVMAVFFFTTQVGAMESLEQKLATLKLEEKQALVMIKKMQRSGRLGDEEAGVARREIASVKEEDVEQIRHDALEELKSVKSVVNK